MFAGTPAMLAVNSLALWTGTLTATSLIYRTYLLPVYCLDIFCAVNSAYKYSANAKGSLAKIGWRRSLGVSHG